MDNLSAPRSLPIVKTVFDEQIELARAVGKQNNPSTQEEVAELKALNEVLAAIDENRAEFDRYLEMVEKEHKSGVHIVGTKSSPGGSLHQENFHYGPLGEDGAREGLGLTVSWFYDENVSGGEVTPIGFQLGCFGPGLALPKWGVAFESAATRGSENKFFVGNFGESILTGMATYQEGGKNLTWHEFLSDRVSYRNSVLGVFSLERLGMFSK